MTAKTESAEEQRSWGLTLRVIALLSLALLPLGLIAIIQTQEYAREALRRSELAILALTERAASAQSELIEHALGATRAIGAMVPDMLADEAACSAHMSAIIEAEPRFAFAGFVPAGGVVRCSSAGGVIDLRGLAAFERYMLDPAKVVTASANGAVSGEWVIIVRSPVFDAEGALLGGMTISIPHRLLSRTGNETILHDAPSRPLQLLTFNGNGDVLSRLAGDTSVQDAELPPGPLVDLVGAGQGARAFTTENREGVVRTYAITPIVPGEVFGLGVWESDQPRFGVLPTGLAAVLFPALMWGASLIVASVAMHSFVLVHVQTLRFKMRRFGRSRRLSETLPAMGTPTEFRDMDAEFMAMAENVLRDEAQLENAVREKNILLKEIHHRVSNNLQLLSSITSMKRRKADSPEARAVLRSLQDRIGSLSAIHRNLYLSKDISAIEAGRLIEDITTQHGLMSAQGTLRLQMDAVQLVPQQAVPLSLFVAEAVPTSDAGRTAGDEIPVLILLEQAADNMVSLSIEVGIPQHQSDLGESAIGENLLAAFADQLGGSLKRERLDGDRQRLSVRFRAMITVPDAMDY
ncbi:sensor histidine kinase [Roseisalinus antarcticus]|uniref:histidine kinase n=1 Tax=Roseisalinus antarcticus TaxID=254357 RepID=A0A1Y5SFA4_9RHOB|nr:sensor histidine kinase [Roseisalinus antarcticus]SLN39505.1 Histidine kinase [Roseisalinus antarcticus]